MQEGECGEARERQPSFPDTHSALTFCFVLLTGLRLPVLEKAKEEDQRPWKHHLRESHDPGPPSAFSSTSLLRNTIQPSAAFSQGTAFHDCEVTYPTAQSATTNKTAPEQIFRSHQPMRVRMHAEMNVVLNRCTGCQGFCSIFGIQLWRGWTYFLPREIYMLMQICRQNKTKTKKFKPGSTIW